jgi:hypothetical protein
MKTQIACSCDTPYSGKIIELLGREFPNNVALSSTQTLDLAFSELLGTKQNRYGPKPSVESQASIREVMRHYMSKGQPIPVMVPWGSEKPDGGLPDIAEVLALKAIACLQSRFSSHYAPGLKFRIRVEDASAPHLFVGREEKAKEEAKLYTDAFRMLPFVLGLEDFIEIFPESCVVTSDHFSQVADGFIADMEAHLTNLNNEGPIKRLQSFGWRGQIAEETVWHYLKQYEKLYPNLTVSGRIHILARYFSGAMARSLLNIRGDLPEWEGKFLDLSFTGPVPGSENYFARRLYYRTIPLSMCSGHLPPWRGKGYTVVTGDDARARITSFQDRLDYNPLTLTMARGDFQVNIRADYVLED